MPFADAMDLSDDYKVRPPVHVLVSGYFGFGKTEEAEDGDGAPADWPRGPVKGA